MRPRKAETPEPGAGRATLVVMRQYIAAGAPNSVKALANLEAICRQHLLEGFNLEIIDVLEFPLRALADGILVTPSLSKIAPSPGTTIVGDLSDRSKVLRALGIKE